MNTHVGGACPRHGRRRGMILLLGALFLLFIVIPVVGLAIDGGNVYMIKARLQTAAGGAALSAAQSLSQGLTPGMQMASASATANDVFLANLNVGMPDLAHPHVQVTFPPAPPETTIVRVDGSVQTTTYFVKVLGVNSLTVRAAAEATRRDVNIMVVSTVPARFRTPAPATTSATPPTPSSRPSSTGATASAW
jgi:uncharacterized membrane protein